MDDDNVSRIISTISSMVSNDIKISTIDHRLGCRIDLSEYDKNDCTICYGDIDFVRNVRRTSQFIPGVWCNFENMKCSTYYTYLGKYLLNHRYHMMPIRELLRRHKGICADANYSGLFIRPDSGAKPFSGHALTQHYSNKIQSLIGAIGPDCLIVASPYKHINAEWRFVICDRVVVAGSRYLPTEASTYPNSALRLAYRIAEEEWQPDRCYTVDIAEHNNNMYLLEINSFSCSGFYNCDVEAIVCAANKAAISEWNEYQDPMENCL